MPGTTLTPLGPSNPHFEDEQPAIAQPHRRPWARPTLTRLAAGDAEVGTRATGDGSFTTS